MFESVPKARGNIPNTSRIANLPKEMLESCVNSENIPIKSKQSPLWKINPIKEMIPYNCPLKGPSHKEGVTTGYQVIYPNGRPCTQVFESEELAESFITGINEIMEERK